MFVDVPSALTHLEGSASGETYDADRLIGLDPVDGRPLLARYDLERAGAHARPARRSPRARRRAVALARSCCRCATGAPVHLGEGATPLLRAPRLGAALGLARCCVKDEGLNPTGSFKARGMAAAVSPARELGATRAGGAHRRQRRRRARRLRRRAPGCPCTWSCRATCRAVNRDEARGLRRRRRCCVDGLIDDVRRASRARSRPSAGWFDVSTLQASRTASRARRRWARAGRAARLGAARRRSSTRPAAAPGSSACGRRSTSSRRSAGSARRARGWSWCRPRAARRSCALSRRGAETAERWEGAATRAGGLRVPAAVGDKLILAALRESGGTAVAVSEEALTEAQGLAGRLMGRTWRRRAALRWRRCGCCASAGMWAEASRWSSSTAGSGRSTRRRPVWPRLNRLRVVPTGAAHLGSILRAP